MIAHVPGARRHWRRRVAASAATATLALLAAAPSTATAAGASTSRPAWWSYDRAPSYYPMQSDVVVLTRDGTPLECDLNLPGDGAQVIPGQYAGVVVEFTPYAALRSFFNGEAKYLASRGYAALVCNVRGTGYSGGTWQGASSAVEATDNYDVVEWMAAQSWSNGRIAQIGHSYGAFTAYRVAALQPPHLVTILPMQSSSNLYSDVIYPGGIKSTPGGTIDNWPAIAAYLSGGRIDPAAEYAANAAHPLFDDYWKQVAISTKYDQITVPVLTMGGYDDGYFRGSVIENQRGVANSWAILGPWRHAQVVNWDACAFAPSVCNQQEQLPPGVVLAWLDHWVKQLPGAPLPAARITSYEGPVGVGAGWREGTSFDRTVVSLALTADGTLARKAGGHDTVSFTEPNEPAAPGGSVSFTSAPMAADQVMAGPARLHLVASLDTTDANFYVELVDVAADGAEAVVNDGFLKASHRESDEYETPVKRGRRTGYDVTIRPDHHRFVAGHRVKVRISGGSAAALLPAAPTKVTVHTGASGSYLRVPVSGIA